MCASPHLSGVGLTPCRESGCTVVSGPKDSLFSKNRALGRPESVLAQNCVAMKSTHTSFCVFSRGVTRCPRRPAWPLRRWYTDQVRPACGPPSLYMLRRVNPQVVRVAVVQSPLERSPILTADQLWELHEVLPIAEVDVMHVRFNYSRSI